MHPSQDSTQSKSPYSNNDHLEATTALPTSVQPDSGPQLESNDHDFSLLSNVNKLKRSKETPTIGEIQTANEHTHDTTPSHDPQAYSTISDKESRLHQKGLQEESATNVTGIRQHIADSAWCERSIEPGTSNKSQAASSTEREHTRSSTSNTVSRAPSSESRALHPSGIKGSGTHNHDSKLSGSDGPIASVGLANMVKPDNKRVEESDPSTAWFRKNVLTLDGGGIRGYASLLILQDLMQKISELENPRAKSSFHPLTPEHPITEASVDLPKEVLVIPREMERDSLRKTSHYLPCHYFDYITGTSTGGVIAIMLSRFGMTVAQCLIAYERFGNQVFKHPRKWHIRNPPPFWSTKNKYHAGQVEDFFKEMVKTYEPSKATRFPQKYPEMCRTIVIAMQRHEITETPYLFRSYIHPSPSNDSTNSLHCICPQIHEDDFPIWKVARATTAAPFYFKALEMKEHGTNAVYIDGGFGANNPSEQVYASMQELSDDPRFVRTLISIGTGTSPHARSRDKAVVKLSNSNLRWISRFIGSAIVQATDSEKIHHRVRRQLVNSDVDYIRLNVEEGIGHIKLDEFKGEDGCETLGQIRDATARYLATESVRKQLSALAHLLVSVRHARAYQSEPGVPASQSQMGPDLTQKVQDTISAATEDVVQTTGILRCQDQWEIFVHGVVYRCKFKKCVWTRDKTGNRKELRQHYVDKHSEELRSTGLEVALDESRQYPIRDSAARNTKEEGNGVITSPRSTFGHRMTGISS